LGAEVVHGLGARTVSKPPFTIAAAVHVVVCTVVNVVPSVVDTKLVTVEIALIVVDTVVVPGMRLVSTTVVERV
jgi:hypothetical protein